MDQLTKQLALTHLDEQTRIPLVGDLLGIRLAFNSGAAFSFGEGFTPIITSIGLIAMVIIGVVAWRARRPAIAVALGLVGGGAAGNILDRLLAEPGPFRGRVTDFLMWGDIAIGNLADVFIGAAVGLWVIVNLQQLASRPHRIEGDPDATA